MKEIKTTRTIEEITAYEANDGTRFNTKEECEKYESSAEYAISEQFKSLMIREPFTEYEIYEYFGYGSEEYTYVTIEIKDERDLNIALMYQNIRDKTCNKKFNKDMIGKRLLVNLGNDCYDKLCYPLYNYEELIDKFKNETKKYFMTEEERKEDKK